MKDNFNLIKSKLHLDRKYMTTPKPLLATNLLTDKQVKVLTCITDGMYAEPSDDSHPDTTNRTDLHIATYCNLSERTVRNALNKLEDMKLVKRKTSGNTRTIKLLKEGFKKIFDEYDKLDEQYKIVREIRKYRYSRAFENLNEVARFKNDLSPDLKAAFKKNWDEKEQIAYFKEVQNAKNFFATPLNSNTLQNFEAYIEKQRTKFSNPKYFLFWKAFAKAHYEASKTTYEYSEFDKTMIEQLTDETLHELFGYAKYWYEFVFIKSYVDTSTKKNNKCLGVVFYSSVLQEFKKFCKERQKQDQDEYIRDEYDKFIEPHVNQISDLFKANLNQTHKDNFINDIKANNYKNYSGTTNFSALSTHYECDINKFKIYHKHTYSFMEDWKIEYYLLAQHHPDKLPSDLPFSYDIWTNKLEWDESVVQDIDEKVQAWRSAC